MVAHATQSPPLASLPLSDPAALGLDPARIARLCTVIEGHIAEGRYPGARIGAVAKAATAETLWLLYSQTKMVTAAALWQLVDQGALSFADRVADHLPEFARFGKGEVTIFQLLTHQGGFPNAQVIPEVWSDHGRIREAMCDFTLEWTPGTQIIYHATAAHWVAAMLIEARTGRDYRTVIRQDLLEPLGIGDLFVGVPPEAQARCADMHALEDGRMTALPGNTSEERAAGVPGGGGYATAAAMAAFYQMLLAGGALNGVQVLSPRVVQYATRNHSGERPDGPSGIAMHRGMTPATRGTTPTVRGLGTIASPATFGHGGAGSSYSWGDPESGLSFTYLSNARLADPWHSRRLDQVSTLVHAALVDL
jgi:CubicO group peptidase (beta-lactamase class C family)